MARNKELKPYQERAAGVIADKILYLQSAWATRMKKIFERFSARTQGIIVLALCIIAAGWFAYMIYGAINMQTKPASITRESVLPKTNNRK